MTPSFSHTSSCCRRLPSCRYNENSAGLGFINSAATLKCSNLISLETERFNLSQRAGREGGQGGREVEAEEGVVTAFSTIMPYCKSVRGLGVI